MDQTSSSRQWISILIARGQNDDQAKAYMKDFFSPGSLVTIAGGALTVVGATAYATGSASLSLPTIFYGIPILLGGLALKSSELQPPSG